MKTNAKIETIQKALKIINKKYEGNIEFREIEQQGKRVRFTLRIKESKGPGSRRSPWTNHRIPSACWHVHGDLFDEIFQIEPDAIIYATGKKIEKYNNWQDWNIGNKLNPCYFSDACDCNCM